MKKQKQSKPVATPARCSLPAQQESKLDSTVVLQLQLMIDTWCIINIQRLQMFTIEPIRYYTCEPMESMADL